MEVTIEKLGAKGDGITHMDGKSIYVAFGLPNEVIDIELGPKRGDGQTALIKQIIKSSPDRITPPCVHYEKCGGCALQHLSDSAIANEKRQVLEKALERKGFHDLQINETLSAPAGTRRRVRLACLRLRGRTILGFNERAGTNIIDLKSCPVSAPGINAILKPLRKICTNLPSLGKAADIQVTLSDKGPDVVFYPKAPKELTLDERFDLVDFAEANGIARIAIESKGFVEPVAAIHDIQVNFAGYKVALPVGAFLQPSKEGEVIIANLVAKAVAGVEKIADLYAGCGSLTFPIAANPNKPTVHAVDGAEVQINALRKTAGGTRVTSEIRDLADNPLDKNELNKFEAVVFDPPRAGALSQAEALAGSNVEIVVAVSCNPATMARDLRILVDGGYRLQSVTPIDQFTWSGHVEAVAILTKQSL